MAPAKTLTIPINGLEARKQCRTNIWDAPTAGIAPAFLQANLIVLPQQYANDFILLCLRNPVPCPLLASSTKPGDFRNFKSHIPGISDDKIASEIDIRTDISRYNIYVDGLLTEKAITSIEDYWDSSDHVAFLIGCSFSFDDALARAGLTPPHMRYGRNVPMYRTNIPLCPAGIFIGSNYVVSMRFYEASEVERVRDITRPYVTTHGEPLAWGWDAVKSLGIDDINTVDWGDLPVSSDGFEIRQSNEGRNIDGLLPVFWGCGVTPQEAVMRAKIPGVVVGHAPGHMVVLDLRDDDVIHQH